MTNTVSETKAKVKEKWFRSKTEVILITLGLLFALVILYPYIFITIGSGHAGVKFLRFLGGTVTDKVYAEGIRIIAPWDKMYIYDVRVQEVKHEMAVLSVNGLKFDLKLSIRFHPDYEFLGILHKRVGQDYMEKIVIPEVESVLRRLIGKMKPEEVYTTKRAIVQKYILRAFLAINEKNIILDDVIIRHIELPPTIKIAIERKLEQQQIAQEYDFRIEREKKEKQRKKIEAEGIKLFQDIVTQSLTEKLLRWKGVEATLELAKSKNSKVIVIGGGRDGLPIILDTRSDTRQYTEVVEKLVTEQNLNVEETQKIEQSTKQKISKSSF